MSDLKCVRLIAGDEIMGYVSIDGDTMTIKDAAAVHVIPSQTMQSGQFSIGLLPWIPYSEDNKFSIPMSMVLTTHTPALEVVNNYNRLFGSGIQIAPAGALK